MRYWIGRQWIFSFIDDRMQERNAINVINVLQRSRTFISIFLTFHTNTKNHVSSSTGFVCWCDLHWEDQRSQFIPKHVCGIVHLRRHCWCVRGNSIKCVQCTQWIRLTVRLCCGISTSDNQPNSQQIFLSYKLRCAITLWNNIEEKQIKIVLSACHFSETLGIIKADALWRSNQEKKQGQYLR